MTFRKESHLMSASFQSSVSADFPNSIDWRVRVGCRMLLALYLISLALPAIYESPYCPHWSTEQSDHWLIGLECLIDGAAFLVISLYFGSFEIVLFPWLANLLFFVGLACLWRGHYRMAYRSGVIATLLAFTTWIYWPHYTFADRPIWSDFGSGYGLWQLSMILLAVGAQIVLVITAHIKG